MPRIVWTRRAFKQLEKIDQSMSEAIIIAVRELAAWPECRNVKALSGMPGYRLRVGRYRVLFTIHDGAPRIVRIEEVKKRDERTY
jgi:mRNA interferase RelE/StbE